MDSITVTRPLPPIVLHQGNRKHWRAIGRIASERWKSCFYAILEALNGQPAPKWEHATIEFKFYFDKKRRRDPMNFLAAMKWDIDAFTTKYHPGHKLHGAGIILDDDWAHLEYEKPIQVYPDPNPRVEITVRASARFLR